MGLASLFFVLVDQVLDYGSWDVGGISAVGRILLGENTFLILASGGSALHTGTYMLIFLSENDTQLVYRRLTGSLA